MEKRFPDPALLGLDCLKQEIWIASSFAHTIVPRERQPKNVETIP